MFEIGPAVESSGLDVCGADRECFDVYQVLDVSLPDCSEPQGVV